MTRINCIPPTELNTKHLVAEYRELPRLFKLIKAAQDRNESVSDKRNPVEYKLGPGHVRFFYNKGLYLIQRQQSLVNEMIKRGFNPTYTNLSNLTTGINANRMKDWTPTSTALAINRKRIANRLAKIEKPTSQQ